MADGNSLPGYIILPAMRLARGDVQVRRFMTVPGIGPITALCYLATIDDPPARGKNTPFEPYSHAESKKMQKIAFRSTLRPNQISFSHSQDPNRTIGSQLCCDAQRGISFGDGMGSCPSNRGSTDVAAGVHRRRLSDPVGRNVSEARCRRHSALYSRPMPRTGGPFMILL
jgi:hypothetical protein